MIFHLRKPPDIPVTDELANFVVAAYNQAVNGLINQLDKDFTPQATDDNMASTPGG
jgi:hypothetical protein